MMDNFFVGAYWNRRGERVETCAFRLHTVLLRLSAIDPLFREWQQRSPTAKKDAITPEALRAILESGKNRRDNNGAPIEELGYHVSLWNGQTGEASTSLRLACGLQASAEQTLENSFTLTPPRLPSFYTVAHVRGVLEAIVDAFDPDWAVIDSHELREIITDAARPYIGWITYVKAATSTNDRQWFVATEEVFDSHNREHLLAVQSISNAVFRRPVEFARP